MSELSERLVNLFGALALGVTDQIRSASAGDTALGGETAAALVMIGHTPGLSIDRLGRVLRLSHPGTVRLVDRLASAGLAVRNVASHDRRVVALCLTESGKTQREALLERRRKSLEAILQEIDPEDLIALERISDAVLRKLPSDASSALTICRFCNENVCVNCPMRAFDAIG